MVLRPQRQLLLERMVARAVVRQEMKMLIQRVRLALEIAHLLAHLKEMAAVQQTLRRAQVGVVEVGVLLTLVEVLHLQAHSQELAVMVVMGLPLLFLV